MQVWESLAAHILLLGIYKKIKMVSEKLFSIGFFILIIGIVIIAISLFLSNSGGKSTVKGGGIVFIGPFPIFGAVSDKKILYILFGIGIIIFILSLFLRRFL